VDIRIEHEKKVKTIKIAGNVSLMGIKDLRKLLEDLEGFEEIRIDLANVPYADSEFLNLIYGAYKRNPGKKIVLLNPGKFVSDLLDVTRIEQVFEIVRDTPLPSN